LRCIRSGCYTLAQCGAGLCAIKAAAKGDSYRDGMALSFLESIAMKTLALLTAAVALALSTTARADDAAMLKLASQSGCMTCHHLDPGAKGPDGLAPIDADAKKLVGWVLALKPAAAAAK
jgi:mono/diheme cytochrome c family protein